MFIDEAQINVRGGDGGAGCASFLREAHRDKGGPDGGDGGAGGDVIFVADPSVATLLRFTREIHFKAQPGAHGTSRDRHGRSGADLRVAVPAGTTVRALDGELLADLVRPGDAYLAAHGGRGGRGNARFLSNARRAPAFAEQGEAGEESWVRLELRLLADVALVGFPNVGKSTFISSVSAAKPKVADYPFTTLTPHLGVVTVDDEEFVVADIPGLIEGAADGRGLGHQFLRHVERSRVLLLLLDPLNTEASLERQREVLLDELEKYRPELLERPQLVAVTKADAVSALPPGQVAVVPGAHVVSSVTGEGVKALLRELANIVRAERERAPAEVGFVVHRPRATGFSIERDPTAAWVVAGPDVSRAVSLNDMTDATALSYVHDRLRGLGVFDALDAAGCSAGDTVRIGELDFEYVPEERPSRGGSDGPRRAGAGRKRGGRKQKGPYHTGRQGRIERQGK